MTLLLTSPQLEVVVNPEHGAVISSLGRPGGPNLLWRRPGSDLDPLGFDLGEPGIPSVDSFDRGVLAGGWFTMFPGVGPPGQRSDVWMHGEAARIPWSVSARDDSSAVLTTRTPVGDCELTRSIVVAGGRVFVQMGIVNSAAVSQFVAFGEHPCFPRSVFAGGTLAIEPVDTMIDSIADPVAHSVRAPAHFRWPNADRVDGGVRDLSELPKLADGRHDHLILETPMGSAVISSPSLHLEVVVEWDAEALPWAMLWQHFLPESSPWAGDVFALEPTSTRHRTQSEGGGRDRVQLGPGEQLTYWMSVSVRDRLS